MNELSAFWKTIRNLESFIFGYITPNSNVDYTVITKEKDEVPFYFSGDENQDMPEFPYKMGTEMIIPDNKKGEDTTIEKQYNPIFSYWSKFKEVLLKLDPKDTELRRHFDTLIYICTEIKKQNYLLYSEKVDFILPRGLLNTIKGTISDGYELCGIIAVSPSKGSYTYETIFHTEEEHVCHPSQYSGGIFGEIEYHTHAMHFIPQSMYGKYEIIRTLQGYSFGLNYYNLLVHECFSKPSFGDIKAWRSSLSTFKNNACVLFTYSGIYVCKFQKPIKKAPYYRGKGFGALTEAEEKKYYKAFFRTNYDIIYSKLYPNMRNQLITSFIRNPENYIFPNEPHFHKPTIQYFQRIIPNRLPINTISKYKMVLEHFYNIGIELDRQFTKNDAEPMLNIGNKTDNKIVLEYYPVEYNKETGLWEYPNISIEVYPRFSMERRGKTPKRISMIQ